MTINLSSRSNFTSLLEIVARMFIGKARSFLTKPEAYSIQRMNAWIVNIGKNKEKTNKQTLLGKLQALE